MMQQPICQQEQIGGQQSVGHQMVLCPVRLVYETQILVQPGDQIHPNQTIFINPQNTPPWAQNRQAQNQILYVQQMPNNMAPSLQQHLDQNQLYLQQNYSNFQMQQAIMAQNSQEQIRPGLQITNMIPSNMIQHLQANVNSNIQGERNIGQSLANFTQTHPNNQVANVIQNPIVQNNRQIMANIGAINQSNQSPVNTQTAELQRQGIYMNVRPQGIQQQVNPTRPIMTMNSTQNATNVQNMQQNFGQSFVQNVGPRAAQIQNNVNVPRSVQPMNMIQHIQSQVKPVEVSTAVNVSQTVVNSPMQSIQTFAYRPIHPRPQYRQIAYSNTMNNQTQTAAQSIPKSIGNINNDNRFISPPVATTVGTAIGYVNTEHPFNRKRKSESPDEIHKKVAISSLVKESITGKYGSMTVKNISTSSEIGVNTSPVHRTQHKSVAKQNTVAQINHNEAKVVKYVDNVQQTTLTESGAMKPATITKETANQNLNTNLVSNQNEKDKMIRNTVYTQARGRLLNDKEEIKMSENIVTNETKQNDTIENTISNDTTSNNGIEKPKLIDTKANNGIEKPKTIDTKSNNGIEKPKTIDTKANNGIENPKIIDTKANHSIEKPYIIDTKQQIQPDIILKPTKPKEVVEKSFNTKLKELIEISLKEAKNDIPDKQNDIELKTAITNSEKPIETPVIIPETKQVLEREQQKVETVVVKEENTKIKEEEPMQIDDSIVREKQFTLTHVLDGYVIQESNIAFPIRKPLKEKTLYTNAQELMEQQSKWDEDTTNKIKDEILKDSKSIDLPVLPFHCLHLNNDKKEKDEEVKKEEDIGKDNPFESLQQSTLKSWTVDQVAIHLSKYDWSQTVSVLQEHEIDGESLFLVTKSQLVNIGVREEHAEAICEFVKS